MHSKTIILALATTTSALIAGVYYSFSVAINPAFAQLSDRAYIEAMQHINVAIVNPVFALSFFGAPLILPLAAAAHWKAEGQRRHLLVAASVVFWIGSLGVTALANIPLNETLASFPTQQASGAQASLARAAFAASWNRWHAVRTVASIATLVLVVAACLTADTTRQPLASANKN